MGKTILIIPSPLPYGVANHFLYEMALEWARLGHTVTADPIDGVDWIVSVNIAGLIHPPDPRLAGVKRLALIVDDPINHTGLYFYRFFDFYPVYVDRTFCDVVGKLGGWEGKPLFCPHGAVVPEVQEEERPIDLLFLGTNEPVVDGWDRHLKRAPAHWQEWIADYLEGERRGAISALLAPDDWKLLFRDRPLAQSLVELDHHVRRERRLRLFDQLREAGLTADIYGLGWECPSHRVHGPVTFRQALALMGRSKVVLNLFPNFEYALHERLLSAMAAGAVVATDGNRLVEESFVKGEEYIGLGDLGRVPKLPASSSDCDEHLDRLAPRPGGKPWASSQSGQFAPSRRGEPGSQEVWGHDLDLLRRVIEDDELRVSIAKGGQQKVLVHHTWAHRARYLHDKLFAT